MKEARAVARLENPNICAVYGLEEIGEHNFIVMQYIEGETLASLLRKGPLGVERALEFAEQIAGALAAAHVRGILHRDVKPQNVVVTVNGEAKVLDFGLAKLVQRSQSSGLADKPDHTSQLGLVLGTFAYMSPEQTRAGELDCRTDVFSFGIVLHEMLSGKNPFLRDARDDTLDAIKTAEPSRLPEGLPAALVRIDRKCLEKEIDRRYETAEQLLTDLRQLRKSRERATMMGWRQHLQHYALAALLLLIVLLGGVGYAYRKATRVHTLAVMPILNQSGDPEKNYLSEGLTRSLFDRFSYLPRLKVKLPTVIPARQNEQLVQAGRDLKAEAVLCGDVIQQGDKFLLRVRLLNTADGSASWEQTYGLESADMFALQDAVTSRVTSTLGMWLIGNEKKLLVRHQTDNPLAMSAYMRGRYFWSLKRDRENIQTAIKFFDQAINLDPSFAQAYSGRADCYVLMTNVLYGPMQTSEAIEKASYDARKALEIEPLLAEAHTSMGTIYLRYNWDWQQAEKEFKLALDLNPDYAPAHFWYSNLLAVTGRSDEAIREAAAGKSLDPYSQVSAMNYARTLYYARRFDEGARALQQIFDVDPNYVQGLHIMGLVQIQQGDYAGAMVTLERLHSINPLQSAAVLGYAYGKAGKRIDALKMIQELDEFSKQRQIPPLEKALVYIGLGERDKAFQLLEQAYSDRFANLVSLTTDPIYDDLRPDPRFAVLARRIGLVP
jgi:TolB-like protein/Tfp pilus assembly protein PilF